jgi:hypothetical protein
MAEVSRARGWRPEVGETVRVNAYRYGSGPGMESFTGVVEEKMPAGYNVREPNGRLWFRTINEIGPF